MSKSARGGSRTRILSERAVQAEPSAEYLGQPEGKSLEQWLAEVFCRRQARATHEHLLLRVKERRADISETSVAEQRSDLAQGVFLEMEPNRFGTRRAEVVSDVGWANMPVGCDRYQESAGREHRAERLEILGDLVRGNVLEDVVPED